MGDWPKCLSCKKKFNISSYGVNRTPLLLSCGHTFCQDCISKWAKGKISLTCPECFSETNWNSGKESVKHLCPSIYHVGIMKCFEDRTMGPLLGNLNVSLSQTIRNNNKPDTVRADCSECITAKAAVRCVQCQVDMCKMCFSAVHHSNWKLLREHYGVPLRESLFTSQCKHHHRLLEFYCEDDQCPVCPECMLLSSHRDHKITRMVDRYDNLSQELRGMVRQSDAALKYSGEVKSSVRAEIENAQMRTHHKANNLHQRFQYYIGILQARYFCLLQNLELACKKECDKLTLLRIEIEQLEKPIREALDDAELMLSKETRRQMVVDPEKLIEILKSCENLPYELEVTEDDTTRDKNDNPVLDEHTECDSEEELDFVTEDKIARELKLIDDVSVYNNSEHKLRLIKECPDLIEIEPEKLSDDTLPEDAKEAEVDHALLCQLQEPPAKHQELVVVTFIITPSNFFVQRCVDRAYISTIERGLKVYGRRKPLVDEMLKTVNVGDYCAAVLPLSHCWYRARIVQLLPDKNGTDNDSTAECHLVGDGNTPGPNNLVEVEFMDYGNTAQMQISCLRQLPNKLRNIPALALPCSINNICPMNTEGWAEKDNLFFFKVVGNHPLLMTTVRTKDGRRIVDLHKPGVDDIDLDVPTSVRDAMLFLEIGTLVFEQPPAAVQSFVHRSYLTPCQLNISTFESVFLSHIQSPKRFFVQLADSNMTYLMQLMHEIQQWVYDSLKQDEHGIHKHSVLCPYKGMVCLAEYIADGQWYRVNILEIKGSRMVRVLFVDYGNEENVHFSRLLKIPDTFLKLPTQALACSLSEVLPLKDSEEFSESCLKRFYELSNKEQMLMEIHDLEEGAYHVDLFDYNDEDPSLPSVSDRLFREGLVVYNNKTEMENEMDTVLCKSLPPEMELEYKEDIAEEVLLSTSENISDTEVGVKCRVTSVVSPSKFHVQTESQLLDLNRMMISLQEDMHDELEGDNEKRVENSWSKGNICLMYSSSEQRWCRGSVVSINETQECVIKLLDYGWEEQGVPVAFLQMLPSKYESIVGFSTACCLAGVHPAGGTTSWTATAITAFKNMVSGKECFLQILKNEEDFPSDFLLVDLGMRNKDGNEGAACFVTASSLLKLQGLALSCSKESSTDDSCTIDPNSNDENFSTPESGVPQTNVCSGHGSDDSNAIPHTKEQMDNVRTTHFPPCTPLPIAEYIPCTLSHIETSNHGYIRRVISTQNDLDSANGPLLNWEREISSVQKQAQNNELSSLEINKLKADQPCLSWYVNDEEWHRAVIVSCDHARQTAIVRYVDYGTLEKVPLNRVKSIPDALLNIPKQAYHCKIHDMPDVGDQSDIVQEILPELKERALMAYVRPDDSEAEQKYGANSGDYQLSLSLYLVDSEGKLINIADKVIKNIRKSSKMLS